MIDTETFRRTNPLPATIEKLTGKAIVRHKIACPWREDSTPSLHIYDDGHWWDFGSGIGGDVIDFVGYFYFGAGYDPAIHFIEVVDRLGSLDIRPSVKPLGTARKKPQRQLSMDAIRNWHDTMPSERREYWYSRGLLDTTIDSFLLGWDGRRYTIPLLYRNIPFGVKRRRSEINDGSEDKYLMAKGSRAGIFNCDVLADSNRVVICEGEIDCMLLNQYGFPAVSSTGGARTWRKEWAALFCGVQKIWILYDNDKTGREGACHVQSVLRRAKTVSLPDEIKDVGELTEAGFPVLWLKEQLE